MDDELLCERIQWERLGEVLRALPDDTARVALLRMRGHTERETARAMGLRLRTVTHLMLRAKQAVAREMPEAAVLLDGRRAGRVVRGLPDVAGGIESVGDDLGVPAMPGWEESAAERWAGADASAKRSAQKRHEGTACARVSQEGPLPLKNVSYRIPSLWAGRLRECLGDRAAQVTSCVTRSEASVVVLWLEGLTQERIADELELTKGAVNTRLVRARRRLAAVAPDLAERLRCDWRRTWRRPVSGERPKASDKV